MSDLNIVENGTMGRVAYARIAPNEDISQGIEKFCISEGFKNAFIRGALGSLIDGCVINSEGMLKKIQGPAVEVVSFAGEVRSDTDGTIQAKLSGVLAGPDGSLYGGIFASGLNIVCMTFEVTVEEWIPFQS